MTQAEKTTTAGGNGPAIALLLAVLAATAGIGYYAFFSGPPVPNGPPPDAAKPASREPVKTAPAPSASPSPA
jgi:hypothetical protein